MRLGRDGIAGLIGLAFSLALLPYAFGLPQLPIVPIGPGFYPKLVLTFMAATCALLVLQDVIVQRPAAVAPQDREAAAPPGPPRAYGLVAAAFVVVAAYIGLMPYLGFRIATALFVAAFHLVLERPTTLSRWAILAAIALGTAALTYVLFDQYLLVLLPRGTWTSW
jgi:putative tricarboxylic transport membrane protein